jgi:hypothetical protein
MDKADGRDRRGRLSAIVPNALRHLRHRCRTWHAMRTKAGRGSTSCSETVAEETPGHTRWLLLERAAIRWRNLRRPSGRFSADKPDWRTLAGQRK